MVTMAPSIPSLAHASTARPAGLAAPSVPTCDIDDQPLVVSAASVVTLFANQHETILDAFRIRLRH